MALTVLGETRHVMHGMMINGASGGHVPHGDSDVAKTNSLRVGILSSIDILNSGDCATFSTLQACVLNRSIDPIYRAPQVLAQSYHLPCLVTVLHQLRDPACDSRKRTIRCGCYGA